MAGKLFVREVDDQGKVRYRRPTSDPRGSAGPVLAAEARPVGPFDLLGAPDPFPLEWLETPPDWLGDGEGVRVVLAGPEVGRAAGYIRLHNTCYQDGTGACRQPPPVPYDAFHRGEAEVIDENGQVKEVSVGAIAVVGGHSSRAGAKNATAAIEFIDQPEKAKLRGVLVEDEVGLLFLGACRPDVTRAEAVMINQSDTSGEWWPLFEHDEDGRVGLVGNDMIGIALVTGGAFRKSIPERFRVMAAALGRELDENEVEVLMHEHEQAPEPKACSCHDAVSIFAALPPREEPVAEPLLAAVPLEELNEVRSILDDLVRRVEEQETVIAGLQRELTQMKAAELTEDDITLPDRLDETEAVVRAMEERIRKMEGEAATASQNEHMDRGMDRMDRDGPRPSAESRMEPVGAAG